MDNEEQKKSYRKGIVTGIFAGMIPVLIVAIIALLGIENQWKKKISQMVPAVEVDNTVSGKMNTLLSYIDYYFLYDYDKDKMADEIYKGMLNSLGDPYSKYYTADEYTELMESSNGQYNGIGVVVTSDQDTGAIRVVQPYEGSPGEKAGILPDDLIIAVDGKDITDMELDAAVDLIKGDDGTIVTLTVIRDEKTFDVEVTRGQIDVITVSHEMLENNTGYIRISQFDGVTANQFSEAINDLINQGMTGLVVDIRNNPGGRLDIVNSILDSILPEGLIVYTEDKYGNKEEYKSDEKTILDVPCAVLVNSNSASASEIFSGALQDYGVGEIIGTQTYGKGIVQSIMQLSDGSAVKLTIEDYYTPNGNNIHKIGITPDEIVELDEDAYEADGTDSQLNAALEYLKNAIK